MTKQTNIQDVAKLDATQPKPLSDAALDDASGGIIAILIGLLREPTPELGDGSVRRIASGVAPLG